MTTELQMKKIITLAIFLFIIGVLIYYLAHGNNLLNILNWQSNPNGFALGQYNVMPVSPIPKGVS